MKTTRRLIPFLLFLLLPVSAVAVDDESQKDCHVTIGIPLDVIVQDMGEFYHMHYAPYKNLSEGFKCSFGFKYFSTCESMVGALQNGSINVGVARAACYLRAREDYDVEGGYSFEIDGRKTHRAVLLVRKDSPYEKIEDLRGARFSGIRSKSFVFRYYPMFAVKKHVGEDFNVFFREIINCSSIVSSVYAVIYDQADVVSVDEEFLQLDFVNENLRPVNYSSFEIPYPIFFVSSNKDAYAIEAVDEMVNGIQGLIEDERFSKKAFAVSPQFYKINDDNLDGFRAKIKEIGLYGVISGKASETDKSATAQ